MTSTSHRFEKTARPRHSNVDLVGRPGWGPIRPRLQRSAIALVSAGSGAKSRRIRAAGRTKDVVFEPADSPIDNRIDAAYRAKYRGGAGGSIPGVPEMTGGFHSKRNLAQRAPSARAGIPDSFHECAQTFSAARAESAMFAGDFETCDGSKNRRLQQCKISIGEVLISVTLSWHGEVAEWPKAAVCYGCRESQNGPEIEDFRPVFYLEPGWRWVANDGSWAAFGHTAGHTRADANVCLMSTRCVPAITSTQRKSSGRS